MLDRPGHELADALRLQRDALKEKQSHLARAIRAVRAAEESLEPGGAVDPATLRKIIEVIGVQNDMAVMKKYYSTDEAWEKRQRYYEEGPSEEWQKLYRDVRAALGTDPASDVAQSLADRWLELSARAFSGDPEVQTDSMAAWVDRDHWPPAMKRRLAEFQIERGKRLHSAGSLGRAQEVLQRGRMDQAARPIDPKRATVLGAVAGARGSLPRYRERSRRRPVRRNGTGAGGALDGPHRDG